MIRKRILTRFSDETMKIYRDFAAKEGAQHIAKPTSIEAMRELLDDKKPTTILEVGGGIGALSFVCLKYSDAHLNIFEDNPFCIDALKKNLKEFEGRYTIHSDYKNYTLPNTSFDLVIFDGGTFTLIDDLVRKLDNIHTVFFEGNRIVDRAVFRKACKEKYICTVREHIDSSREYKMGHEIICRRSKNMFVRNVSYVYWEIIYYMKNVALNGIRRRRERLKNISA